MSPTISVCIPVFNGEATIGDAIGSVLGQTHNDFEVVVVDNCSTDRTVEVVRSIGDDRVRILVNDRNLGMRANWDRALDAASAPFVKLLCADDILYPSCLAHQVEPLQSDPDLVFVTGRRDVIDGRGAVLVKDWGLGGLRGRMAGDEALRVTVRSGRNLLGEPLCVLMRSSVARSLGGFSDLRPYLIDLDFWFRLLERGPLYALDETVGAFRVWKSSTSVDLASTQSSQARGLYQHMRSRRPDVVRRSDIGLGSFRAIAVAGGRMLLYRCTPLRNLVQCRAVREGREAAMTRP